MYNLLIVYWHGFTTFLKCLSPFFAHDLSSQKSATHDKSQGFTDKKKDILFIYVRFVRETTRLWIVTLAFLTYLFIASKSDPASFLQTTWSIM